MKFVDRHEELARLDRLCARGEGGLAVIWGRRRVGKTRLLIEWCSRHDGLYTVADQSSDPVQRAASGPEWDVVSLSLDRRTLLAGEARWHEGSAAGRIERDLAEVAAKPLPAVEGWLGDRVVRLLFVPEAKKQDSGQVIIVDGSKVLRAGRAEAG